MSISPRFSIWHFATFRNNSVFERNTDMSKCRCSHTHEKHNESPSLSCRCGHSEASYDCCGHGDGEEKAGRVTLVVGSAVFAAAIITQLLKLPIVPSVLYIIAYIFIGFGTFRELLEAVLEGDIFGENTLMTVSSIGAMIIGEMAEGCAVMLLFAIGEMLEHKARKSSESTIERMLASRPKHAARLMSDGTYELVSPELLAVGDIVTVNAGEAFPCDGEVTEGTASVDTSQITGESLPVAVKKGDRVRFGYISLDGSITVRVSTAYKDNTFSKILETISGCSERKSKSEHFVGRFARIYTPVVMICAVLVMIIGGMVTGDISTWIYRGLVFLAASCPCAFVISVPLTFFFGISEMTRLGLLVKGSEYLERIAKIKTVAFDKTGTITNGTPSVIRVNAENGYSEAEVISLCASSEQGSNHPIALCITEYAKNNGIELRKASCVREIPGKGIYADIDGRKIACGNKSILRDAVLPAVTNNTIKVYVAVDGSTAGVVELSDEIKKESAFVVSKLKSLGVGKTVMLTGDSSDSAEEVAAKCCIDEVYKGLDPQEKSEVLEELRKSSDGICAFVGDGINDAPVLTLADVGIAVGGTGAEISLEAADAVILGSSLEALPRGMRAARRVVARVRFNVIFAISVKLAILALTLAGFASMGLAVFGDVGVTIIVILNALRKISE